jgi:hypothetical protein
MAFDSSGLLPAILASSITLFLSQIVPKLWAKMAVSERDKLTSALAESYRAQLESISRTNATLIDIQAKQNSDLMVFSNALAEELKMLRLTLEANTNVISKIISNSEYTHEALDRIEHFIRSALDQTHIG